MKNVLKKAKKNSEFYQEDDDMSSCAVFVISGLLRL